MQHELIFMRKLQFITGAIDLLLLPNYTKGWGLLYWHCVACGEFHHASCLRLRVPEPHRPRGLSTNLGLCHRCYEDQVYRFHEERELYEMWLEDKPQEEHAPTAGPQAPSQVQAPLDKQVAPLE